MCFSDTKTEHQVTGKLLVLSKASMMLPKEQNPKAISVFSHTQWGWVPGQLGQSTGSPKNSDKLRKEEGGTYKNEGSFLNQKLWQVTPLAHLCVHSVILIQLFWILKQSAES